MTEQSKVNLPVSCFLSPVSCICILYPVSCILYPVTYILYLVTYILCPVSCIKYHFHILFPVFCIFYLLINILALSVCFYSRSGCLTHSSEMRRSEDFIKYYNLTFMSGTKILQPNLYARYLDITT